ncbi:MAG: hypothetical protein AB1403_25635 [Candidatus Riflebacteria bacterium]
MKIALSTSKKTQFSPECGIFLLAVDSKPAATGTMFDDVPLSTWAPWIEELYEEEIGFECRERHYCPDAFVSRADMAAFLVPTFNMP